MNLNANQINEIGTWNDNQNYLYMYCGDVGASYTSIIESKNACCFGALLEEEKALFNELYTTYHFDDLIRRSLDFVKSKSSLFEQYENDLLEQIREAYWNEPDL